MIDVLEDIFVAIQLPIALAFPCYEIHDPFLERELDAYRINTGSVHNAKVCINNREYTRECWIKENPYPRSLWFFAKDGSVRWAYQMESDDDPEPTSYKRLTELRKKYISERKNES